MNGWTPDELAAIGRADELEVASLRSDRYGTSIVGSVVPPEAVRSTLRVAPR